MWTVTSILDPNQSAEEILEHVTVLVGTSFTVVASSCFVFYCFFMWLWRDCGLGERLRSLGKPKDAESPVPNQKTAKFLNMNSRLVIGMHVSCFSNALLRVINVFTSTEIEALCVTQGILLQYTDWLMLNYNFVIAFWLFVYIFFGKKVRSMHKGFLIASEIMTHLFCVIGSVFWVILPLTTTPSHGIVYGKSGPWCWMRPDRLGYVWRMAGLYGPLWVMIVVIIFLYACCLSIVFISYHRLNAFEMRGLRSKKLLPKFANQMFLVIHSEKDDMTLIRLSAEWKAYIKLILYPAVFLLVWSIPTVNRVSQIFLDKPNSVLQLMHRLLVSQQGFLSVIIYPMNPVRQLIWIRRLLTCDLCRKKSKDKSNFIVDMSLEEDEQVLISKQETDEQVELEEQKYHGNSSR